MGQGGGDTTKASQISANASFYASNLQAESEKENRTLQTNLFDKQMGYMKEQEAYNRELSAANQRAWEPYKQAGNDALSIYKTEVLDPNSEFNREMTRDDLQNSEGYKFVSEEGQSAINNTLAAKGGLLSGAAVKAASAYNQGMASQEFQNEYSRFSNDRTFRAQNLLGLTGLGAQATQGYTNAAMPTQLGSQMSALSANYGANMGNIISNGANNQSNIAMASGNQQSQIAAAGKGGPNKAMTALSGAATGAAIGSAAAGMMGGAAAGAATGAAAGSVVPGIGTAIGAILGAVVGLL